MADAAPLTDKVKRAAWERPSLEEFLPLLLCIAGALGVLPFAILRALQQHWGAALLDAVIVASFIGLGVFLMRSRQVRFASICLTVLCLLGYLATLYVQGSQQLFWGYPALVVAFYLLRAKEAVIATGATLLLTMPILYAQADPLAAATVTITMVLTAVFAYAFAALTRNQRRQLINLATRDPLTAAGNRRALSNKMSEVIASWERHSLPASLIILDLDNFKSINDEFGHGVGDQILVKLAEIIRLRIRLTDSLYRIGGEEFVVLVENQNIDRAARLAEQLRTLVEAYELAPDRAITISLGVSELQPGESSTEWLRRADDALYDAKRSGRNLTRVAHVTAGIGQHSLPL